jgi:hypothetical protein
MSRDSDLAENILHKLCFLISGYGFETKMGCFLGIGIEVTGGENSPRHSGSISHSVHTRDTSTKHFHFLVVSAA